MLAPLRHEQSFERQQAELERFFAEWDGKLNGRIVMLREPSHLEPQDQAALKRWSDSELGERARAPELYEPIEIDYADPQVPRDRHERQRFWAHAPRFVSDKIWKRGRELRDRLNRFLGEQGVRLVIHPAAFGDGGTIFPPGAGSYRADAPLPPPSIALTPDP